jgi:hypothetical protein
MEAETASIVAFSRREVVYRNWDVGVSADITICFWALGEVNGGKDST